MRKVSVVIASFAFVLVGVVFSAVPQVAASSAVAGDPVKGKKIFETEKCGTCHNGKMAEDLSSIGSKRDAAWLTKYLAAPPAALDPKAPPKMKMPATKVKGADLDDLVSYLMTMKGK
jgi:mono/diheme cytochrome c family protein